MLHPGPALADGIQDLLCAGAVGDIGRGQVDQEKPPVGIDRDVPLAADELLAGIVAPLGGHRRLDRLAVDDAGAGAGLACRNVPEARYEQRDMATLGPGEYAVDAVVSFFAIFHIDRSLHPHLLHCLRSYLGLGGALLITTGRDAWEGEEDFLGARMAWSHFDQATNRALIEDAGFTVLLEDKHRGNPCGDDDWHPIFPAEAR